MKEKLEKCYERLQALNIITTRNNMEILLQCLYDIQAVYKQLKEEEENGGHDRPAADPGGRNGN